MSPLNLVLTRPVLKLPSIIIYKSIYKSHGSKRNEAGTLNEWSTICQTNQGGGTRHGQPHPFVSYV